MQYMQALFLKKPLTVCRYSTTTNLLTNDTTTYPAVPNLPVPICYPQTASVVMLPLEYPGYNPRILVIGGSSNDGANPGTPASPATYLLDFSIRPFAWVREDMSSPRVMPDGVLLPDGVSFPSIMILTRLKQAISGLQCFGISETGLSRSQASFQS